MLKRGGESQHVIIEDGALNQHPLPLPPLSSSLLRRPLQSLPLVLLVVFLVVVAPLKASATSSLQNYNRCLADIDEVRPQRYVYLDSALHLNLETSDRLSHRLSTEVLAIFLRERLGYTDVAIVQRPDPDFNATAIFHRLSGLHSANSIPDAMVNLEVWLPPGLDTRHQPTANHIELCGLLGPAGRLGWFLPERLAPPQLHNWRDLQNPAVSSLLRPSPAIHGAFWADLTRLALNHSSGGYFCQESFCFNGTFTPPSCRVIPEEPMAPEGGPCALLLADYPESTRYLWRQIEDQGLLVQVVWVGPHLESVVKRWLLGGGGGDVVFMFLGWTPSELVPGANPYPTTEPFPTVGPFPGASPYMEPHPFPVIPEPMRMVEQLPCGSYFRSDWQGGEEEYGEGRGGPISSLGGEIGEEWQCRYELRRLEKASWARLKQAARPAYEAVHRVSFSPMEYARLLSMYAEEDPELPDRVRVWSAACRWMQDPEHRLIWRNWVPELSTREEMYIGGIFPMSGSLMARGKGIALAARMAANAVNANDTVLRDYHLRLWVQDGQCSADKVMHSFIDYIRRSNFNTMAGILGPACSDTLEPLAGVSRIYSTVVISYGAEGSTFSDRDKYPYFFRTIGENKQYRHVYMQLLHKLGWERVASLTEDGQKYAEYLSHLQDLLQANGVAFVANRKFPRERLSASSAAINMSQYLEDLRSKRARVIIADLFDRAARAVMCQAYLQHMTMREGYVWFLPSWSDPEWYDTDRYNGPPRLEGVPCNTSQMVQAINGHLSLTQASYGDDNQMIQEPNMTVRDWKEKYQTECRNNGVDPSDYAGYAYDAVWTYAKALDNLLELNRSFAANLHSENATAQLVRIINETDFMGASGHIRFFGGPSRLSTINVLQWVNNRTNKVGIFRPRLTEDGREAAIEGGELQLNLSALVWLTPDGQKPDDGREPPSRCVLEGLANFLNVDCEVAIVVVNIVGFGALAIILFICFVVVKRKYDRKVQATRDYFRSLGIDLESTTSPGSLDKWEIPRERVVINRKLGEGAFGTVYGGEASLQEGQGWVAVAVKTLKVGSSTEEKLDFLSEAEIMKRFDHQNVVRLLGVCTKSEPVYTIMEFMLYGDLKTYLLARRHLVNQADGEEESDEVSAKRLTGMALDVARALSYLAELKYVHRDVACRNCLVHASRAVKLGDFGMTRPMYENDYYKFNRKGMLPVRWMAPESLGLGIFSPMSDVWSFGVLLYEIVTFGSFPFQGLSNNQVLEHVKAGNSLCVPQGVKPQLEGMLRSCWSVNAQKRPHSSELVEYLANSPRLVCPCLDVPLSSVQIEGTDQLELNLSEKTRKCSVSVGDVGGSGNVAATSSASTNLPRSDDATSVPLLENGGHSSRAGTSVRDPLLPPTSPSNPVFIRPHRPSSPDYSKELLLHNNPHHTPNNPHHNSQAVSLL